MIKYLFFSSVIHLQYEFRNRLSMFAIHPLLTGHLPLYKHLRTPIIFFHPLSRTALKKSHSPSFHPFSLTSILYLYVPRLAFISLSSLVNVSLKRRPRGYQRQAYNTAKEWQLAVALLGCAQEPGDNPEYILREWLKAIQMQINHFGILQDGVEPDDSIGDAPS